jgi:hypothetical protein
MFRFALPQSSAQCCERADSVRLPAAFAAAERRDYNLSRIFAFAIQPNPMCGGSENMQTPYENFALILYMPLLGHHINRMLAKREVTAIRCGTGARLREKRPIVLSP